MKFPNYWQWIIVLQERDRVIVMCAALAVMIVIGLYWCTVHKPTLMPTIRRVIVIAFYVGLVLSLAGLIS